MVGQTRISRKNKAQAAGMPASAVHAGFSLVEMAVVLVILGFVISALILPVTAQRQAAFLRQTDAQLELANKALLGFAQTHGRLPCPASANGEGEAGSSGREEFLNGSAGACSSMAGFVPAATLGLSPVDAFGFMLDGWGRRIRYAVAQNPAGNPPFTTPNGMATTGMANLLPNLRVLDRANGSSRIENAVAVVFSLGATGNLGSGGADESANLDADNVFVSHDIEANGPNGEFDHMLVWLSPYVLYNAMIQAGQLP